ncbi:hypothetical protein GOODEAATRI_029089 [Goodea atripinnis]|uniref:Uncharacterized protein n=1 Tax=Goodea atripinnis TaxID=208336 RepID=A0ABV0MZ79_9TELE
MLIRLISHSPSVVFRFPGPQLSHILLISSSPSSLVHTPLPSVFKFSGFHCSPLDSLHLLLHISLGTQLCILAFNPASVPLVYNFSFIIKSCQLAMWLSSSCLSFGLASPQNMTVC